MVLVPTNVMLTVWDLAMLTLGEDVVSSVLEAFNLSTKGKVPIVICPPKVGQ